MKRREFMTGAAGLLGGTATIRSAAAALPCPPLSLAIPGGSTAVTACGATGGAGPALGQAMLVGTNTALTAVNRPSGQSDSTFSYAYFNSYGSGAFVEHLGAKGSYVMAGSGGHGHPCGFDALLFDFADYTWKMVRNTNGVSPRDASFAESETSGSPNWEVSGATGNCPAPPHPYMHHLEVGTTGKIAMIVAASVCNESRTRHTAHVFDIAGSKSWSRLSTNSANSSVNRFDGHALYDPTLNRYWLIPASVHGYNTLEYLDATDWTFKTSVSYPYLTTQVGTYHAILDDSLRCLAVFTQNGSLQVMDLKNVSAGFRTVSFSGSLPGVESGRWAKYNGSWYFYAGNGDQTIYKLTPPASNPTTSAWAFATTTVGGAALPNGQTSGFPMHRTRWCYVPALDCIAWIPQSNTQVALLRPG